MAGSASACYPRKLRNCLRQDAEEVTLERHVLDVGDVDRPHTLDHRVVEPFQLQTSDYVNPLITQHQSRTGVVKTVTTILTVCSISRLW